MRSNILKAEIIRQLIKQIIRTGRAANWLTLGIGGEQWLATLLIGLLLLPVFSLPVSAAVVVGSRTADTNVGNFEPVNAPQWFWESAYYSLDAKVEEWMTVRRNAAIFGNGDDAEKPEAKIVADTDSDKSGKSKKNESAKKDSGNIKSEADEKSGIENPSAKAGLPVSANNKTIDTNAEISGVENSDLLSKAEEILKNEKLSAAKKNSANLTKAAAVNLNMAVNLPVSEEPSLFYPENNLGAPAGKTEQSAPNSPATLRVRERNGVGSFSFDLGFASLPGRGINAGVGAVYNSRLWNKSYDAQNSQDRYTYNVDKNWLAPGFSVTFGSLDGSGQIPGYLTDESGSRHQLTYNSAASTSYKKVYDAKDGSFIQAVYDSTPNRQRTYARFSDGSTVFFDYAANTEGHRRATALVDSNGNYVQIVYVLNDTVGRIDYLYDSLGRYIKFNYDASQKLISVSVPEFGSTTNERETIRFYYENLTLNPQFAGTTDAPTMVSVLKYVYFPGTKSGFKYEYSPLFGMIYKITRLEGMTLSADKSSVQTEGQWAAATEYSYPRYTSDIPNPGVLSDVPKYGSRTDDWIGRTGGSAPVTQFSSVDDTANEITTSTITSPNGTVTKTVLNKKTNNQSSWDNGLIKETSVTSAASQLMQKSVFTWDPNSTSNPRLSKVENTNEALQVSATQYDNYDQYNNVTTLSVHDFTTANSTELKRVETSYETGAGWINRRLVHLPKSVKVYEGTTIVSRTDYEYDKNGQSGNPALMERGAITGHLRAYNPYLPPVTECTGPDDPGKITCLTLDNYDAATDYRGNVTKVTSWADATNPYDPLAETTVMNYDVAGNIVSATVNCCQLKQWIYSDTNKYAYPIEVKSGPNGEFSEKAGYDFNTGLVTSSTNENNQVTNYEYEIDTLRAKKTIYPNGGYVLNEYSDKLAVGTVPGFIRTTTTLEANKTVQSYSYFDGRGAPTRSAVQTPDGWSVSAVGYDSIGRAVKNYNPFYAATPTDTIPTSVKYTEVVSFDALGRTTQVQLQDGTFVYSYPNEAAVTFTDADNQSRMGTVSRVKDQADKERRQITDALGRVIRVDEPTASGLGGTTAPNQPTFYSYDGNDNLAKVVQIEGGSRQERKFKYDSLSRLTSEKQIEANATLNDAGSYVGTASGQWTKVLKYDMHGLLTDGYDARGVNTHFVYDSVNRVSSITFSDGTPTVSYTYDQARSGYFNKRTLTRVETAAGGTSRPDTPTTATEFDYDLMGRVAAQRQSIDTQTYNLSYGYNLAGQLTSETYPSGKVISTNYDTGGRLSNIKNGTRFFLNSVGYLGNGNQVNGLTLGNQTSQGFAYNDRLQLKTQNLTKPGVIIQQYDYNYGELDGSGILKNNGKLQQVESTIGTQKQWTQKFSYDAVGRLSQAEEYRGDTSALSYKQKFDYDRFGNLYRKNASNPTAGQATPLPYTPLEDADISKSTNRFTSNTQYDDAGNVIQDTKYRNMNFSYDANGRMYKTSGTASSVQSNAVYDASGQRVAQQIDGVWQFFIYDLTGKKVAEYGGTQAQDEGGIRYIFTDWQGSTRAITGEAGQVQARMDYTAFGEEINANVGMRTTVQGFNAPNKLDEKYAQTERDKATGLDHTWFRKLENQGGRWTSPDPYNGSMSLGNPQSFNRYSYVGNQPTNFIDPSGLNEEAPILRIYTSTYSDSFARFLWYLIFGSGGGNVSGGGIEVSGGSSPNSRDETLPCPERDKEVSLPAAKALELYTDGTGKPAYISIGDIQAGFPVPTSFPTIQNLIKQGTGGKSNVTHKVNGVHSLPVQTQGWQAAVLGRITFDLIGNLTIYEFGLVEFSGTIGVIPDTYNFDAGNRGVIAQASTLIGSAIPGKPYDIITVGRYDVSFQSNRYRTFSSSCK